MTELYTYIKNFQTVGEKRFANLSNIGYINISEISAFVERIGGLDGATKRPLRVLLNGQKEVIAIGENTGSECFNIIARKFMDITELYRELYTVQAV